MIQWVLASLHLLALPLGLGGVWMRGRALRRADTPDGLRRALAADNLWGIAALIWIVTGAMRAFSGLEKGTQYYVHNHAFQAKLTLFLVIFVLELWPMVTLIYWRTRLRRGQAVDTSRATIFAGISMIQSGLIVLMVLAAAAMARGMFG